MPSKSVYSLLTFLFLSFTAFSAKVDTVSTYSSSMQKDIRAVVITPEAYDGKKEFPVVYLLHGYSGSYRSWIEGVPELEAYADRFGLLIVCPDGNYGSWYLDSPKVETSNYETYIATELVNWIDGHYRTIKDRNSRAISGLSMGGHGAFYLAFKHQDIFGSAGSMSGGVDLRPFPKNWELEKYLGSYAENPENWEMNSVINMTHLLTPNSLDLIFSCGTDDFFYEANVRLHEKLLYRNIPHTFISAPGAHTLEFWADTVKYHLQFFHDRFEKSRTDRSIKR